MNRTPSAISLTIGLALVLIAGVLSGCELLQKSPTPTLVAQRPATDTPTPDPTATPTSTPTATRTSTSTATPTPRRTARPTATRANTPTPLASSAAKTPVRPKPTATPATLRLVITEAETNKMAKKGLAAQQDVKIDNPKVDFRPGEMYVSGDTVMGFFKVNIGVLAAVEPVNGKAEVRVKEIYVNGDRATGFLRKQIEAMIAPHLDQLAMVSDDFYVEDIVITEDAMIITGHNI